MGKDGIKPLNCPDKCNPSDIININRSKAYSSGNRHLNAGKIREAGNIPYFEILSAAEVKPA
jgi:hypothetical protein